MKSYSVTIQMKAIEQYLPVLLFITLYKVVLTFESVEEIPIRSVQRWLQTSSLWMKC